eukprot:symbB.v1.2.018396.t1/scaffold1435.1/size118962/1
MHVSECRIFTVKLPLFVRFLYDFGRPDSTLGLRLRGGRVAFLNAVHLALRHNVLNSLVEAEAKRAEHQWKVLQSHRQNTEKEFIEMVQRHTSDTGRARMLAQLFFDSLAREWLDGTLLAVAAEIRAQCLADLPDASGAAERAYQQAFVERNWDEVLEYVLDVNAYLHKIFSSLFEDRKVAITRVQRPQIAAQLGGFFDALNSAISRWGREGRRRKLSDFQTFLRGLAAEALAAHKTDHAAWPILSERFPVVADFDVAEPSHFAHEFSLQLAALLGQACLKRRNFAPVEDWVADKLEGALQLQQAQVWALIKGCSAICPCCGSKCDRVDKHTEHRCCHHLLPAFNGWRVAGTCEAALDACKSCKNHEAPKRSDFSDHLFPNLQEYLQAEHPEWLPFPKEESRSYLAPMEVAPLRGSFSTFGRWRSTAVATSKTQRPRNFCTAGSLVVAGLQCGPRFQRRRERVSTKVLSDGYEKVKPKLLQLQELLESMVDSCCSNDGQESLLCVLFLVNGAVTLKDMLRLPPIMDFFDQIGLTMDQRIAYLEAAANDSEYFEMAYGDPFKVRLRPGHEVVPPPLWDGEPSPWDAPAPGRVLQCRVTSVGDDFATLQMPSSLYEGRLARRWWRTVPKVGKTTSPVRVVMVKEEELVVELRHLWPQESKLSCEGPEDAFHWEDKFSETLVKQQQFEPLLSSLQVVTLSTGKKALMLPNDTPEVVGSFIWSGGQLWPVLQKPLEEFLIGALRVGRIQSLSRRGLVVDIASSSYAFVRNTDLLEHRSTQQYFRGRAIVLRIYGREDQFFRARQLHPAELSTDLQGAKVVPDKKKVPKEHLLALPRLGSIVLGTKRKSKVLLQHPPCRAVLDGQNGFTKTSEVQRVYRVCDVTIRKGLAVPVIMNVDDPWPPRFTKQPEIGSKINGYVERFAKQQVLPDGSISDGLVLACSPGRFCGYLPVSSMQEAQKLLALGTALGKMTVRDYMTFEGSPVVIVNKVITLR